MICKQLCGGTSCFVLDVVLPQSGSANAEINPAIVNAAVGLRFLRTYTSLASEWSQPGLETEEKKRKASVRAGDEVGCRAR